MPDPATQPATQSHHPVTLNYDGATVTAVPRKIQVKPEHTISFKLGAGPANGKIRVTFQPSDQGRFSTQVFNDGDPDVIVTAAVVATTYQCALLVDNVVVAQSSDTTGGGEIEPVTGT